MKYIKQFEKKFCSNVENSGHWLVPTDSRFERALKKIGVPKSYREVLLGITDHDYIYVGYAPWTGDPWGWMPYEEDGRDYFKNSLNYEFMGVVNIEIDEIELRIDSRKYNL